MGSNSVEFLRISCIFLYTQDDMKPLYKNLFEKKSVYTLDSYADYSSKLINKNEKKNIMNRFNRCTVYKCDESHW